jgi:hypothetical protein
MAYASVRTAYAVHFARKFIKKATQAESLRYLKIRMNKKVL